MLFTLALLAALTANPSSPPVGIIFDTDMGNDIDDALALSMLHALHSRKECRLLGITITKDNRWSAPFVDLVNTFFGRDDLPIGVVRNGVTPKDAPYTKGPCLREEGGKRRYPRRIESGEDAPEAVGLLRRLLAAEKDGSVVLVQVGFSTNLARLLESPADAVSPLSGRDLVRAKVRLLSTMAGSFSQPLAQKRFREYNVVQDLPSAKRLFAEWPTPIVASGYEIGNAILYPATSIETDYRYVEHHPIAEAYGLYKKMPYDRQTWDLTSVLYAVRPDRGYFELSPPGTIVVENDGYTRFEPSAEGKHRYLILEQGQIGRIVECMELLASQPPDE